MDLTPECGQPEPERDGRVRLGEVSDGYRAFGSLSQCVQHQARLREVLVREGKGLGQPGITLERFLQAHGHRDEGEGRTG
jgi:hypothetical protein